jgi:hypothetical protein
VSTFDSYETFVILLVAILALDTVWGLLAHLGFTGNASQKAEMKWAWINFVTAAVILIIYFLHSYLGLSEFHFIALLTIAMVVRTVVDYTLNIQFYCP